MSHERRDADLNQKGLDLGGNQPVFVLITKKRQQLL